jgi:predicted DNA-binding antitoxin AbrB/MazE fold protein
LSVVERVIIRWEALAVSITVEATIESGQLKLKEPVVLAEGTPVRVTIEPLKSDDPFARLVGKFSSGRTDGAQNHDKYLYGKRP